MVSVNRYCIIFFLPQLLILILWVRNFLISEFYIVCVFGRDIDRQKFYEYGWDNLFQKSGIVKECGGENNVISNRSISKLVICECESKEIT